MFRCFFHESCRLSSDLLLKAFFIEFSAKFIEYLIVFCSQLMWYQDSFLLDPTDRRSMDSRGDRHMLTIRNIQSSDFGNYRFDFHVSTSVTSRVFNLTLVTKAHSTILVRNKLKIDIAYKKYEKLVMIPIETFPLLSTNSRCDNAMKRPFNQTNVRCFCLMNGYSQLCG